MDKWQKTIRDLCEIRGWSVRRLAGDMGVSPSYLQDVVSGRSPASPMLKLKLIGRDKWTGSVEDLLSILPPEAARILDEWEKMK